MTILIVKGAVFTGKGEGRKYIQLPWVREQITKKIGFVPYAGTLNIMLLENETNIQKLREANGEEIIPPSGFFRGKLFRASVRDASCAVVIPQVPDYPKNVLEVVAKRNLRERLGVEDGDVIELTVEL